MILKKYIPDFEGFKTSGSDAQVLMLQYNHAKAHYDILKKRIGKTNNTKIIERELTSLKSKSSFMSPRKKNTILPITTEWWLENRDKGMKFYYKSFYKGFYAIYFDIRDLAKTINKQILKTKITKTANIVIIETIGNKPKTMMNKLIQLKENGFQTIVIYLEIDPELSVVRDLYREEHSGRGVGVDVIIQLGKSIGPAMESYKKEGQKLDGLLDRYLHFKWKPSGDSPIKGTWQKVEDKRYSLIRKKKGFIQ